MSFISDHGVRGQLDVSGVVIDSARNPPISLNVRGKLLLERLDVLTDSFRLAQNQWSCVEGIEQKETTFSWHHFSELEWCGHFSAAFSWGDSQGPFGGVFLKHSDLSSLPSGRTLSLGLAGACRDCQILLLLRSSKPAKYIKLTTRQG